MFFDKWRALATIVIVLAIYFLEPSFFSEAINAAFWLLVSFFLAGLLARFFRRYALRKLIAFDMGGVLTSGDFYTEEMKAVPEMFALIKRLKKRYRVALWTNNNALAFQPFDRKFGFSKLFDHVIVSGRIGVKKPDKAYYERALKTCGVQAVNTIFVDDDENNVRTARSIGINAIHFKSFEQLIEALKAYGISV